MSAGVNFSINFYFQIVSPPSVFMLQAWNCAPNFTSPLGIKLRLNISDFLSKNFFLGQNIRKKGVFRTRPRNIFSKIFMKKCVKKWKIFNRNFVHIILRWTPAQVGSCRLKTVGGDRNWKSPLFTMKKHVLHHRAKMSQKNNF